jgi:hypothetical protein
MTAESPALGIPARVDAGFGLVATSLALALVLALGLGLRLAGLGADGFWLDEVYSASFANLSAPGTVLAVLLLDVHPPLYYLQLNLWGLLGHGDVWLLLNSVLWSVCTLLAVFWGTRRQFGVLAAILALMLCAVMGSEIYFAHELRMYPMTGCLAVMSWRAGNRLLEDYRFRTALPLIALLALLGATHAASLIVASAVLLYVAPLPHDADFRGRLRTWFAVAIASGCCYLPWLVNVSSRNVAHTSRPSLDALLHTVGGWLLGYGDLAMAPWAYAVAAALLMLGLAAALLLLPALSRTVLCFIVWPPLFGAILSVAVKPVWLDRTFAFCAPFVAIALGSACAQALRRSRPATGDQSWHRYALPLAVVLAIVGAGRLAYLQDRASGKPDHYRELATYLRAHAGANEIIYAPMGTQFWGLSRYLIGPDWGSILQFQDLAELDRLKRWRRIHALFGQAGLERFGLMPESRHLDSFRAPLYTGTSPLPELTGIKGEWVVASDFNPAMAPQAANLCAGTYPTPLKFGRLALYHLQCAAPTGALAAAAR